MTNSNLQEALAAAVPSVVLSPNSLGFVESTGAYLSIFAQTPKPSLVLAPATRKQLSTIITTVRPFVGADKAQLAVKAGGATPTPGAANVDSGLLIDLKNLTGISLSADHRTVSIGAGETWGNVYGSLEARGLAVAGGRTSRSGVGGQLTNGGISWLSPRVGFPCDNVANFEVVLADGSIVNANATENEDLWLALRGGSNNFGIVTRFDMCTLQQGSIWGGSAIYDSSEWPEQIHSLRHFLTDEDDPFGYLNLNLSIGYMAKMGRIMCKNSVYYTNGNPNPPALRPFSTGLRSKIDAMSVFREGSLMSFTDQEAAGGTDGQRVLYMTTTFAVDAEVVTAATEAFKATVEKLKSVEGLVYSLGLQGLSRSLLTESSKRGGNSMGLSSSDGPLVFLLLYSHWSKSEDDELVISTQQALITQIDQIAASKGKGASFKFMPYAYTGQDVIGGYGAESKSTLQATSKKYDPSGFFQKGVPGGFKLFA